MVGGSLLVISRGPFTSIYNDFLRVHFPWIFSCSLWQTEEQKNGKANEQFKEVAIETVTRRFQWICWKIRPMATRWRLKKQWSEHFEGEHKQKWPDMCKLFDRQHLKSDDQDVDSTQNENNIHVYTCLFESLLSAILMFWGTSVLFMLFCSYNNLTQTKKTKNATQAVSVHLMYKNGGALRVDNLIIWHGAGTSPLDVSCRDWSLVVTGCLECTVPKPVCEKKIQANRKTWAGQGGKTWQQTETSN